MCVLKAKVEYNSKAHGNSDFWSIEKFVLTK